MKRYEIIGTTADAGVIAYGERLESLFENAAAGMFALVFGAEPRSLMADTTETFTISAVDLEALLVNFLSELLWRFDTNLLVPTSYRLEIGGASAHASSKPCTGSQGADQVTLEAKMGFAALSGTGLAPVTDLKAITMHNLAIRTGKDVLSARIIFDV
ncbi:MAG: archease [Candidatus Coatesbacteria bacterium]|nr:archease [Candidatus Coatesbacteria bacterium]